MRVGAVEFSTTVEGPGERAAIWFQGCPKRCKGCCNPEFSDFSGGWNEDPKELARKISETKVEGVTLLGGEPLEQTGELITLVTEVLRLSPAGVILFTGKRFDEAVSTPSGRLAVSLCDLVVAGPFVEGLSEDPRRWVGSLNQTIHFITDRYQNLASRWPRENGGVEIVIDSNGVSLTGNPKILARLELGMII